MNGMAGEIGASLINAGPEGGSIFHARGVRGSVTETCHCRFFFHMEVECSLVVLWFFPLLGMACEREQCEQSQKQPQLQWPLWWLGDDWKHYFWWEWKQIAVGANGRLSLSDPEFKSIPETWRLHTFRNNQTKIKTFQLILRCTLTSVSQEAKFFLLGVSWPFSLQSNARKSRTSAIDSMHRGVCLLLLFLAFDSSFADVSKAVKAKKSSSKMHQASLEELHVPALMGDLTEGQRKDYRKTMGL